MTTYQQYTITLSDREEKQLLSITRKGDAGALVIKRAHILLKSAHGMKDADIALREEVTVRTVEHVRR